jgi:hypothetical protein
VTAVHSSRCSVVATVGPAALSYHPLAALKPSLRSIFSACSTGVVLEKLELPFPLRHEDSRPTFRHRPVAGLGGLYELLFAPEVWAK